MSATTRKEEAAAQSIEPLLSPRSIAIIGMTDRVTYSTRVYKQLTEKQFGGQVYFVNPRRDEVLGKKCYPTLEAIGQPVDMALVSVAAGQLAPIVEECARAGVRSAVIYTTGVSPEEMAQIRDIASRSSHMRLLGPNTLGMITPTRDHGIAHLLPLGVDAGRATGNVALLMQSGGLGSVAAVELARRKAGLRYFLDTGSEADITIADCIEYLIDDPGIKVIGAFIEAVRDIPKFLAVARRAHQRGKNLAVLKVGRSRRGAAATLLHTGSMAGDARLYESIFQQHGVLMCHEIEEFVDAIQAAAFNSALTGPGIGIVSGSGGACALMSDLAEDHGIQAATLGSSTAARLQAVLPAHTNMSNPIDLSGIDEPKLKATLLALGEDPEVGATVFFASHLDTRLDMFSRVFGESRQATAKPIYICGDGELTQQRMTGLGFPCYNYPESAIRTIASLNKWASLQAKSDQDAKLQGTDAGTGKQADTSADVAGLLRSQQRAGVEVLTEFEGKQLLAAAGFKCPANLLAHTPEEAASAAQTKLSFPLAAKVSSRVVTHKAAVGGVHLNLKSPAEVNEACKKMLAIKETDASMAFLVEEMAKPGMEYILGARVDPTFGPVVIFGKGGGDAESAEDISIRMAPVTVAIAQAMMQEIAAPLPARTDVIAETIVKMSRLIAGHADVLQEIEINPVIVSRDGQQAVAADAVTVLRRAER